MEFRLWLLRPALRAGQDSTTYGQWGGFGCARAFLVRARDEDSARQTAAFCGGVESTVMASPWADPALTSCEELLPEGDPGVIYQDLET